MGTLVYSMFQSLDGYVEAPGRDIGWSAPDDEVHAYANEEARNSALFLYGRRLYELMSAHWPTADGDPAASPVVVEFARIWRDKPKVVVSSTLTEVGWNSRLVRDTSGIAALKARTDGEISVGGAGLAASVIDEIDEFRLFFHPIALGAGTPFFPAVGKRIPLRHKETRTFSSGVVLVRYASSTPVR